MLAADADFQFAVGGPAGLDRHLHQLAHAFLIQNGKRIIVEDFELLVFRLELRIVVAGQTHSRLSQVIGAETEELGFFGDCPGS